MATTTSKTSYSFRELSNLDNLLYNEEDKKELKNKNYYIVHKSYSCNISDLNKVKLDSLYQHRELLTFAIKYVAGQIKNGMPYKHIIWPQELAKQYKFRVYRSAQKLVRNDCHGMTGSQEFWVDKDNLLTFGIRDNKNSKFQAFAEIRHANRNKDSLKLNLECSNRFIKHSNEFYRDGLDLTFDGRNFGIRTDVQKIVVPKQKTGIDKLLVPDKYLNLFATVVDRNSFNEDSKTVGGKLRKVHSTPAIKRILAKLESLVSKDKYVEYLHSFRLSIRSKLNNEVGRDNEDNVTLLTPIYHHKLANHITSIVRTELEEVCLNKGIKLTVIEKPDTELNDIVAKYKQNVNEYRKRDVLTGHTKWSEYVYALMAIKYDGKHPYIIHPRKKIDKSIGKPTQDTPQNDEEVFEHEELYQKLKAIEPLILEVICSRDLNDRCKEHELYRTLALLEVQREEWQRIHRPKVIVQPKTIEICLSDSMDAFWDTDDSEFI